MESDSTIQPTAPAGDLRQPSAPPVIQVRRMTKDDLPQVQAIDQLSFSLPWPASAYRYELEQNLNSRSWVAEVETAGQKRIAGMIVVWLILDEAHIATIAVHPEYRHKGIARRLIRLGLIDAIRRGAVQATLEVRAGNWIAQKLYHSLRFEVVGRRLRYYQDNNEDGIIMTVDNLDEAYIRWIDGEVTDESE